MGHTHLKIIKTSRSCNHHKKQNKKELIQYIHGCCFSPTPITFLREIKNLNFLTWPGLNNQHLLKHLPLIIATALGHLDQEQKTSNQLNR